MKPEEAIEHLKNIAIFSFQDGYTDEARQALDMAIEALSKSSGIPNSSDDQISRQAAIEAVKTYWKKVVDDIPKGVGFEELTQLCSMALEHNANILKAIDQLPSAQSERKKGKWIPQDFNKSDGMITTAVYYYPKCSVRGWSANNTNFCPNCWADMRGEGEQDG